MYLVVVNSWGRLPGLTKPEWTRSFQAKTKAAAMRQAWRAVGDCGAQRSDCRISASDKAAIVDILPPA